MDRTADGPHPRYSTSTTVTSEWRRLGAVIQFEGEIREMKDQVVGPNYADTGLPLKIGDAVLVDNHRAKVEGVFFPGTQEAADCHCEDTGALAVRFDDGIPVLLPFGNRHAIAKLG